MFPNPTAFLRLLRPVCPLQPIELQVLANNDLFLMDPEQLRKVAAELANTNTRNWVAGQPVNTARYALAVNRRLYLLRRPAQRAGIPGHRAHLAACRLGLILS